MKFRYTLLTLLFLLAGTSTPVFAMWGEADEPSAKSKQIVIQKQLEALEASVGAEIRHNTLAISLKEDNQVQLALALAKSPELLAHYDVILTYMAPLSKDHLPLFQCFHKLVQINFQNKILDAEKGKILSDILSQNATLRALIFQEYSVYGKDFSIQNILPEVTDDGLISIQQSLSALPDIRGLVLGSSIYYPSSEEEREIYRKGFKDQKISLGDTGFSALACILSNLTSLKTLSLNKMAIDKRESQVCNQFSSLTNLVRLYLSENQLEGDVFTSLRTLTNLTELQLHWNNIKGEKLWSLSHSSFKDSLVTLEISHNQIDDEGIAYISMLPNLTTLDASHNSITNEGACELSDLQKLTNLNLCKNQLKGKCFKSLRNLSSLKTLDVSCNQITGKKLRVLLKGKLRNSLESLDISHNQIDGEGARYIATLPSLVYVNVSQNKIEETEKAILRSKFGNDVYF